MNLNYFYLLTFLVLAACESDPLSQDETIVEEEPILIIGTIGQESSHITSVGLFHIESVELNVSIQTENTMPLATSAVEAGKWSLDIPEVPEDGIFKVFGWMDIDGDTLYDPLTGESPAFAHINQDTLNQVFLFLGTSGWQIGGSGYMPLADYEGTWFLFDDSKAEPISKWVVTDSVFALSSGSAHINPMYPDGISISLRGLHPDTAHTEHYSSNISIYPNERVIKTYELGEMTALVSRSFGPGSTSISGNLGRVGLTHVDTANGGRVRGWLAIEKLDGFNPGEITAQIYGTFDVPFEE